MRPESGDAPVVCIARTREFTTASQLRRCSEGSPDLAQEKRARVRGLASATSLWSLVVIGSLSACTEASLYALRDTPSQPDRLAISGRVCTDNPADRSFPLRVIFLVDGSPVVEALDPSNLRAQSLLETVNRVLSPARPNRQIAIAKYGGRPELLTPEGFTSDATVATEAVAGSASSPCAGGCRDIEAAMSLASSIITGDLLSAPRGLRSRTRYLMVLMSTGPPLASPLFPAECGKECGSNTGCLRDCITARLADRIDSLDDFVVENGGADFTMHTLLMRNPDEPDATAWAEALLRKLSEEGGGQFVGVDCQTGVSCRPLYSELSLESLESPFQLSNLLASNVQVRVGANGAQSDSDADGLSDDEEANLGSRHDLRDTDGDGLGDRVEILLGPTGLDLVVPDSPMQCVDIDMTVDDDADGLRDCEELLLGTDPTLVDTDADGVPDWLEFLWGTNYLARDVLSDLDEDGVANGSELQVHSDPRANDPQARAELGYHYSVLSEGVTPQPYFGELVNLTGVTMVAASASSRAGVGVLYWDAGSQALAWQDPGDGVPGGAPASGPAVEISQDGRYELRAQSSATASERFVTLDVDVESLPSGSISEQVLLGFVEQECVNLRVSNILLRGSAATDESVQGTNRVYVYFGEVPRDNPTGVPLFRAALVQVVFLPPDLRDPPQEEIVLTDDDFVLLGDDE